MSREIYISSTPHETRLAIVEKDELNEIYFERENEYTLAGSIYNGRVTRVLPGMQSAFVDIGLERDAFLYITDFMEEQGDAADFDSSESRSAKRSRGRRDEEGAETSSVSGESEARRQRDDRSRRNDRPAPRAETEGEALDESLEAGAESGSEAGEGIAPDGSRRWRGRRGRRRGRGEGGEQSAEVRSVEAVTDVNPAIEAEGEYETQELQPARRDERNDGRGRNDRGRRDGRGRRGGSDRYERPERSSTEGEGIELSASAEPFILPGESLSKYRRGGEENTPNESASHTAKPQIQALQTAAPSTLAAPILEWDGGLTLPGESLSRHRDREEQPAHDGQSTHRGQSADSSISGRDRRRERDLKRGFGVDNGSSDERHKTPELHSSEALIPEVTSQHEPEAIVAPLIDDAPQFSVAETEPRFEVEGQAAVVEPAYEPQTDVAPIPVEQPSLEVLEAVEEFHETVSEYEPDEEASASYRVDPAGPSEFRQNTPVLEEEVAGVRFDEDHGPAEASISHEFTTLQATGELISESPLVSETIDATAPSEHEAAVQSLRLAEAEVTPMPGVFAPGDGELEEELLDEEEGDLPNLQASGFDDTEEMTLENAADLSTMLREMSIDEITRPQAAEDEDDEDFDIDEEEMEEDELQANDEEGEGFAGSDISVGETDEFSESEDFEGEEAEAETTPADTAKPQREGRPNESRRPRDNRRGRDRNGSRDRRGMANSRSNGRPSRHSVQAMDLPAISDLLKPGQEVLVQIAKEPIAKKGARITSHIALPGRFLVFMPTVNHVGVSRKIESDSERRRLKEILLSEKGEASGGFIVRTAAASASEEELRSDLRFLLNLWADIKSRSEGSKSPALIYHDLNLVERVLRDQVSDSFSAIWVDTETEYERVLRFLQRFQPSLIRRVKLYTKDTPLFEQFGITNEINKALRSKVWLKSGGSIVINQTEALVAIDINTGKYVGKTARLEDTIVKTNLDAIPEIVRQIRLRDLGGIIVIDFIDMDERKNRAKVLAALEEELKKDRAPSKVLQFNDFGLVAITRKRVKQSLERTLSTTCGICAGTGMVKSPVTVCNEIYVELRKMQKQFDKGDVMLRVNPEVVKQLKSNNGKWLQEMEEISGKTILVKSDPSLHPEQFDIH